MKLDFAASVPIKRTPRAIQLAGLFDIPPSERSEQRWSVELPIEDFDWHVGLVVGPSGSGKSTLAREAFGGHLAGGYEWPADKCVVDGFPKALGVKDITALLSSVGFSSPPAWLRPFRCLSNGEQFRVTLARAIAESPGLAVMDEFTSTVDRTVAQVGSAAVAKTVRRAGKRFVAVTCHYDVIDWLDPDWLVEMPGGEFTRRSLRGRPPIDLEVVRVHPATWQLFKHHHYLDTSLHRAARCFAALWAGRPIAFASVLHAAGRVCYWREHRTVCLPDFQGVGIGNALSEFVASVMAATGKPYMSTTSNPAMVRYRARSPLWRMHRTPSLTARDGGKKAWADRPAQHKFRAVNRLTAGFRYVGPVRAAEARGFGLI
jgi:ABC-type ATPase involved in cell division/GNAT superfamily N-acetyltransferase